MVGNNLGHPSLKVHVEGYILRENKTKLLKETFEVLNMNHFANS